MIDLTIAVPLIVAIVEMLKMSGLPSRFAPLASCIIGVGGFVLLCPGEIGACVLEGLVASLTASGLYSYKVVLGK